MTGPADLLLEDVSKQYGETMVLRSVSLCVPAGETVAVVGPSGSGKSTLLNIIGSLERPDSGTITLGDTDIPALSGNALYRFRSEQVGFVFQEHHLLPQLTAVENVLLPTLAFAQPQAKSEDRARALLDCVGLSHRADAFPARMSGGERQRVALARALINRPRLLLCDEPTGNLDADSGSAVVGLLLELARDEQVTVLMATHNVQHAGRFAALYELRGGTLVRPAPAP